MANLKYDEKTFPVKVAEYAAKGDTDARIASRLGVALSTFYSYKEQFPEFAEGLIAGRRICCSRVRAILLKVARGQCKLTTKVFKNGELYKTTVRNLPPNLKAIVYFQKHMRVGAVKIKEAPAQADSEISILGAGQTGQTSFTRQTERQCAPAQTDSGISKFEERTEQTERTNPTGLTDQPVIGLALASVDPADGRLSGKLCWPHGQKTENTPAQPDSGISTLK